MDWLRPIYHGLYYLPGFFSFNFQCHRGVARRCWGFVTVKPSYCMFSQAKSVAQKTNKGIMELQKGPQTSKQQAGRQPSLLYHCKIIGFFFSIVDKRTYIQVGKQAEVFSVERARNRKKKLSTRIT